jgi:diadenosine tetraphosphate (Ap4A) HIT family hydrolase
MACELCDSPGGELIWQDGLCRVVRIENEDYPGFCRVIANRHVKEMTDLPFEERVGIMSVVFGVEEALREVLRADKINLASLGNKTPHVHWHVIPRFTEDRHFPNSIWGATTHETPPHPLDKETAQELKLVIQRILG